MNLVKGIAFLLLKIFSTYTADIVSEEKDADTEGSNDHIQQNSKGTERRFIEDFDDKEWHVSQLKDVDFDFKTNCKEETFKDSVNRYRKTLKEDGALVEYVFAKALPVKVGDIDKNKCVAFNNTVNAGKKLKKVKVRPVNDTNNKDIKFTNKVNIATTPYLKDTLKHNTYVRKETEEKSRRASEYQFSSDEYYDEVEDVPEEFCPEFVEVIELEIDILRRYHLECEILVEWRSLE